MEMIVAITLTSGHRLIGELTNHRKEPPAIALQNVRPFYEGPHTSRATNMDGELNFGEWWVEFHRILKLEVLEEDSPATTSSLVSVNNNEIATEKPIGLPTLPTTSATLSVSWLTGRKPIRLLFNADSQKTLTESMQNYCKKLFDNSDFTRLLTQPPGRKRENLLHIGLPKYYVNFHREIRIPARYHESSTNSMQEIEHKKEDSTFEENAKALTNITQVGAYQTATNSVGQLYNNLENMHISDNAGIGNSIPQQHERNAIEENEFPRNPDTDDLSMDC